MNSACQPVLLIPGVSIDRLAAGNAKVFFHTEDGGLGSIPVDGGAIIDYPGTWNGVLRLVHNNNTLFVGQDYGLYSFPIAGGPSTTIAQGGYQFEGVGLQGGLLYAIEINQHAILSFDPTNPDAGGTPVITGLDEPFDLVGNSGTLFWLNHPASSGVDAGVQSVFTDGGGYTDIVISQDVYRGIAADSDNVYWLTGNATASVYSAPQRGGAPRLLTTQADGISNFAGIDSDSSYLYWPGYTTGNIERVPVDGGDVEVIATFPGSAIQVVVSSTDVFYAGDAYPDGGGGGLYRLAK